MRYPYLYLLILLLLLPPTAKAQHQHLRDSLRAFIATASKDTSRIRAYSRLTEECLDTSYSLAMQYANIADSLADKNPAWLPGKILAQTAIGYAYQGIDMPDSASRYFHTAYTLAGREPNKIYLKKSTFALARFYSGGNTDSNLHYKSELLKHARLLHDTTLEIYAENDLGGFYYDQKDFRQALAYWQQGLGLLRRTPRRNHEGLMLVNIGNAYSALGRRDSARTCYYTALELTQRANDLDARATTRLALAEYYQKSAQPDSARIAAEAALTLAKTNGDKELLRDVWEKLASIYEAEGHAAPALNAYKQYILYRDSVTHEERNAADAKKIMRAAYSKELAVNRQQQNNLRAEARAHYYQLLGLGLGLLLLGVLAIMLYYALVKNRKRARTITAQAALLREQKSAIQTTLNEKEVLMREIHHRVKNNLQVISALQHMQAARSQDPAVKAALADSQNRVLSIAFIHQNLYQHDDMEGVEMRSFVRELTGHVLDVYMHGERRIVIRQDIAPMTLDIDTAVPLGLILNELLTNSCKHAFRGRAEGHITIHLAHDEQGVYMLMYEDDGPGLDPAIHFGKTDSLGLRLISQLAQQLDSKMHYQHPPANRFTLAFKDFEARNAE